MRFLYQQWNERFGKTDGKSPFDTLYDLFQELLTISGGDVSQALRWLNDIDKEYGITDQFDEGYGVGDFIDELQNRGYIRFDDEQSVMVPTSKTDRSIREKSLRKYSVSLKKGVKVSTKRHTRDAGSRGSQRPGNGHRATISDI